MREAGPRSRGATLYCTLEPCDHHGRTPPCSSAIVRSGVTRVIVAARDPNPIVDGRGVARLRAAGIDVEEGILADRAERMNEGYGHWLRTGRPLVTLKVATTLDGKVAARDGSSRWITGEEARADAHRLRARVDAIAVGAGTALADDPRLTVRDPGYGGEPVLRVLVDARGRVSAAASLFDGAAPTLVATTDSSPRARRRSWAEAGAEVLVVDAHERGVALGPFLEQLGKREVQSLLLEGGPTLSWSAVEENLVDRVVLYLAPKLLGGREAPSVLGGEGFAPVGAAAALEIEEISRVGADVKVEARVYRDH
jgi:diaminohydroxyphosphoribosylaminopyrimidine deaminase / 5-amino-6-(5-phosphoribosylamino)uracil reductase